MARRGGCRNQTETAPAGCSALGRLQRLPPRLAALTTRHVHVLCLQGVDLDQLLDMSTDELVELFPARQRRR